MKKSGNNWIAFDFGSTETPKDSLKSKMASTVTEERKPDTLNFNLAQELKPNAVEDLAVNSKKVKEVQVWLEQNVGSKMQTAPVLLLTGPTGSGKTSTVKVLCDTMGIQLVEWINPIDQDFDLSVFQAQSARFIEFFMQSKYPSLCTSTASDKRVALVEDFPNFIIHNPSEFAGVLKKCLSGGFPVIFICTDVSSGKLDLSQKLFSQELKDEFNITTISFNASSATLLKGALKRAQSLIETQKDLFTVPSADVVEAIISSTMGDIRCAINQYHFASLKVPQHQNDVQKVPKRKMIAKSCPACKRQIPVACKTCTCGHLFYNSRKSSKLLLMFSDNKDYLRRTERVRRERPDYYDILEYDNMMKQTKLRGSECEDDESSKGKCKKTKKDEYDDDDDYDDDDNDFLPQLSPEKEKLCADILAELNRKFLRVTWKPQPLD